MSMTGNCSNKSEAFNVLVYGQLGWLADYLLKLLFCLRPVKLLILIRRGSGNGLCS